MICCDQPKKGMSETDVAGVWMSFQPKLGVML